MNKSEITNLKTLKSFKLLAVLPLDLLTGFLKEPFMPSKTKDNVDLVGLSLPFLL